jgi:AraC-like DNA-binding protein
MLYRIDLFSVFIFLGIVQGIFLLFFFLSKENRKSEVNRLHALVLISIVATILEIFLMYTGYIVHVLYLVDFSEAFSLLIGPGFYLLVVSLARGPVPKKYYWHLAFPVGYFFMQVPFLLLPEDAKYNAYVGAFRPDLPFRPFDMPYEAKWFYLTSYHTILTMLSLAFYGVLVLAEVVKAFRSRKESFWRPEHPVLQTMRVGTFQILSALIIILLVKIFNERDYGDHMLAAYIALTIYFTSFSVIRQSGFFKQASLSGQSKYKSSPLSAEQQQQILNRLNSLMKNEKPFLQPGFSLPDLAQRLNVSVHHLSQVINDKLQKSFFEMTAGWRVEEAKQLLKERSHIKVEEIAEQVGYNSKSSFNTAFKKITGKTPSEYRDSHIQR